METVGRQGQRGRAIGPGEPDPLPGQPVEMGGSGLLIAVTAQMIGPGRVEGDQEDIVGSGARRTVVWRFPGRKTRK